MSIIVAVLSSSG